MTSLFWFDPNCEDQVARGRPGFRPARVPRLLRDDLETLPMFLGSARDTVLVRRLPRAAFLESLAAVGLPIPRFVRLTGESVDAAVLRELASGGGSGIDASAETPPADPRTSPLANPDRPHPAPHGHAPPSTPSAAAAIQIHPWGWSPETTAFLAPLQALTPSPVIPRWSPQRARVYAKTWSAALLGDFLRTHAPPFLVDARAVGVCCSTPGEVPGALAHALTWKHAHGAVIKARYGQAGRGHCRVRGTALTPRQQKWMEQVLAVQGGVVVEPWLDRVCDLSLQLDIPPQGPPQDHGIGRFFCDAHGRFRGSLVADTHPCLPASLRGEPTAAQFTALLARVARHVTNHCQALGYSGPVGVDMLVCRTPEGDRLKPLVEINPRYTMGRLARCLSPCVCRGRAAVWLLLSCRDLRTAGFPGPDAFADWLRSAWPLEIKDGCVHQGSLFTTDPRQARAFVSVLLVAADLAACSAILEDYPALRAWHQ